MNGFQRCNCCFGQKFVMGLGMVEEKCKNCSGVGYIEYVPDEIAFLEEKEELRKEVKQEVVMDKVKTDRPKGFVPKKE